MRKDRTPLEVIKDYIEVNNYSLLPVLEQAMRINYLRGFDDGMHTASDILIGERNLKEE